MYLILNCNDVMYLNVFHPLRLQLKSDSYAIYIVSINTLAPFMVSILEDIYYRKYLVF